MSRFILWIMLCSVWLIACQAPSPVVRTDGWQIWQVGASSNAVLGLVTQGDRLWVGTRSGVWQIDPATRQVLRHDIQLGAVGQLLPIENGQLWAVGDGGLFFFDGQTWRKIELPDHIKSYSGSGGVGTMAIDAEGNLWLVSGAWRGVSVFHLHGHIPPDKDVSWEPSSAWHAAPNATEPDCEEVPIFETGYDLVYQSSEECRALKAARQAVPVEPSIVTPLTIDAQGNPWWTETGTLNRSVNGTVTQWAFSSSVNAIEADPVQGVWIGTEKGLTYTNGSEWHEVVLESQNHTLDYAPRQLVVDPQGRAWLLTAMGQLTWRQPNPASQFQLTKAYGVRALAVAREGGVWITHGYDLQRMNPDETLSAPPPPQSDLTWLTSERAGRVWALVSDGILEYDPAAQRWQQHLPDQDFRQLAIGTDDTLVALSADDRLFVHLTGASEWKVMAQLDRTFGSTPLFVADNHGGVWAGMSEADQISHYAGDSTRDGVVILPDYRSGRYGPSGEYDRLFIDHHNNLWVSNPLETMRYDDSTWQSVPRPPIGELTDLISTPDGRLWLVSERGIAMYDPAKDKHP